MAQFTDNTFFTSSYFVLRQNDGDNVVQKNDLQGYSQCNQCNVCFQTILVLSPFKNITVTQLIQGHQQDSGQCIAHRTEASYFTKHDVQTDCQSKY